MQARGVINLAYTWSLWPTFYFVGGIFFAEHVYHDTSKAAKDRQTIAVCLIPWHGYSYWTHCDLVGGLFVVIIASQLVIRYGHGDQYCALDYMACVVFQDCRTSNVLDVGIHRNLIVNRNADHTK